MNDDALLQQLQGDLIAIQSIALAGDVDLARAVPTCPGWTVADLLAHLWSVQDWVRKVLRTREKAAVLAADSDPTRAVADFIDGISNFLVAMRAIGPDEECWTFGPPPHKSGFWIRRQAHEHAVHRVDLESSLGVKPVFTPEFAADGVAEIVTMIYPRQVRAERTQQVAEALRLESTDTDNTWTLGEGEPVTTVRATAGDLYLGLWKRGDLLESAQIDGDRGAVERALQLSLTP